MVQFLVRTPPPLLKEGRAFQKLGHLGGVLNFLLEREGVRGKGEVDVEMEGLLFFVTLQLVVYNMEAFYPLRYIVVWRY